MKRIKTGYISCVFLLAPLVLMAQHATKDKPRILISTDIGGTDPDDNQSMIHLLMYSDRFRTEGLVSSPSYGSGSVREILRAIDLYQKDLPLLDKHGDFPSAASLRRVCRQGRQGGAPYRGYLTPTEGSDWIIRCARRPDTQPVWVLVWGGLDDLAQALHDAPDIAGRLRVYWIGGPNKKWSVNSYVYLVSHFPDLWFIEDNASYEGFFLDAEAPDSLKDNRYYACYIRGAGHLGSDFRNYYGGDIKMGDTPSVLYMMSGHPGDPTGASWGGRFVRCRYSPRRIFHRTTTLADTVTIFSVLEFHFKGPRIDMPPDSACFTLTVTGKIGVQRWPGYYLGDGDYVVRYAPKQAEVLRYEVTSAVPDFTPRKGQLVVNNFWPGDRSPADYPLGSHWYTDCPDPGLFFNGSQGARTVSRWRSAALLDWARRWEWLR